MNAATVVGLIQDPRSLAMRLHAPAMVSPLKAACELLPECPQKDLEAFRLELLGDHPFHDQMSRRMFDVRHERFQLRKWNELVYMLIRAITPDVMIETGVFDGRATAVALKAIQRNRKGLLISIDLPAVEAIPDSTTEMLYSRLPVDHQPGWLIPEELREHHALHFGDAATTLPPILAAFDSIDIFQHDSLHTYSHMRMEFEAARPRIRYGGLLLADDVRNNRAFHEQAGGSPYVICDGFGGMLV